MLVDRLLTDSDPLMRKKAAELLCHVGSEKVNAALREALADEDQEVALAARVSLLRMRCRTTLAESSADLRSSDPAVAEAAARLLGEAEARSAVPALLDAFWHAPATVAGAIAQTLGIIGDALAVPLQCVALEHGFVAPTAASALGAIGDDRALAALVRALKNNASAPLRAAAARALGGIPRAKHRRASPKQLVAESAVIPALRQAMNDPDRLVRINASIALWQRGDRQRGESMLLPEPTPVG